MRKIHFASLELISKLRCLTPEKSKMQQDIAGLVPLFCKALLGEMKFEKGGMIAVEKLSKHDLNYSLNSLILIDTYLSEVRLQCSSYTRTDFENTGMAAGCYLGEVIRRNSPKNYRWVNYDDYFPNRSNLLKVIEDMGDDPKCLGTLAVLVSSKDMTMPINKVLRCLEEEFQESTFEYAKGQI